jgi:hypothetical protein
MGHLSALGLRPMQAANARNSRLDFMIQFPPSKNTAMVGFERNCQQGSS